LHVLKSSQAITCVNVELKTNVSEIRLHHQGQCGELPYFSDKIILTGI
jgi:hypothetical protein